MIYTYQDGVKIPKKLHAKITELYCSGTNITEIPATLVNLTRLYCSNTKITTIPDTLVNLTRLHCQSTGITKIPATLAALTNIDCSHTDVAEIPATLVNLTKLYCFHTKMPNYKENFKRSSWDVLRFGTILKIGCEVHSVSDWEHFTDKEIGGMDRNALKFWKKHKTELLSMVKVKKILKIPSKIKYEAHEYNINFVDFVDEEEGIEVYAEVNKVKGSIDISKKLYIQNPSLLEEKLFHEFIHLIDSENYPILTERQTDYFARGMYEILKNNKMLKEE